MAAGSTEEAPIRVVFVEDDVHLARLTAKYLESHGLRVTVVSDGRAAVATVLRDIPDVVLLDLMLPGVDGMDICRELRRRSAVPIVMVTAREEEADRVQGLEGGADDYVAKPFSSRELLARVRAQARRGRGRTGPAVSRLRVGDLEVNDDSKSATFRGRPLSLTPYEFALLRALAERPGRVLSREQLVDLVRGNSEESFDRSIDVHISHLRQKLGDDPRNPRVLRTVRGSGYVLVAEEP